MCCVGRAWARLDRDDRANTGDLARFPPHEHRYQDGLDDPHSDLDGNQGDSNGRNKMPPDIRDGRDLVPVRASQGEQAV